MSALFSTAVKASTLGLLGKKKKPKISSAEKQAREVGATTGKASEKAQAASGREFDTQSISNVLGGVAGPGLGSSTQSYRRKSLKRSR